jgi:hypothetical protein
VTPSRQQRTKKKVEEEIQSSKIQTKYGANKNERRNRKINNENEIRIVSSFFASSIRPSRRGRARTSSSAESAE